MTTITDDVQQLTPRRTRLSVARDESGRARLRRDGQPILLLTATEHYGAITNRAFDFGRYVPMLARSGCNVTRTFTFFRELQSAVNPYSTCKPESIDYVSPYERVGGEARDGQPRHDLDRWNEEYFARLHEFMSLTERRGIVVELTLLSNVYSQDVWALQPFHPDNNVNALGSCRWGEFMTMRNPTMLARQERLVRKIVGECAGYDHVLYEICNEPGAGAVDPAAYDSEPTRREEVNAWLAHLLQVTRAADRDHGGGHLVAGQEAFQYEPWEQPLTASFDELDYDIVNVHPLPNTTLSGEAFDLGKFMSGELRLSEVARFCSLAAAAGKPVNLDEDNVATQYVNDFGWSIHRRRAWIAAMSGCHYDMIDFSIRPHLEDGTDQSQDVLRSWTWALGRIVERFGVADAEQWSDCRVTSSTGDWVAVGCITAGGHLLYIADAREATSARHEPAPSGTIEVDVSMADGRYDILTLDPRSGHERAMDPVRSDGGRMRLRLRAEDEDVLLVFRPA